MGELLKPMYVGTTELPWPEGTPQGPDIHPKEVDPVGRKATWTMTGLATSHVFIVPAVLQAAGLTTDPVALYWAEHNLPKNEAPYILNLGWDAFVGLPYPENQIVFACPKFHARDLIPFLARVRFGTPNATQWDSLHQRLNLIDRQLLSTLTHQPEKPPTVSVELFGLTGPGGTYFWKPPTNPWTEGIQLVQRPAKLEKSGAPKKSRRPFSPPST